MSPQGSMVLLVHSHLRKLEERPLQLICMPLETFALAWKHIIYYIYIISLCYNISAPCLKGHGLTNKVFPGTT